MQRVMTSQTCISITQFQLTSVRTYHINWRSFCLSRLHARSPTARHLQTASNDVSVHNTEIISPVLTSRTNKTALLTPWTSACVHVARSRDVWTRNTWASTPCRVPDLVPNVRISALPGIDGCLPECTSLQLHMQLLNITWDYTYTTQHYSCL